MSETSQHRCSLCSGQGYAAPVIGHRHHSLPINRRLRLEYWRSLLNPELRRLPKAMLPNQLEEVQAALRDALHLLQEIHHE